MQIYVSLDQAVFFVALVMHRRASHWWAHPFSDMQTRKRYGANYNDYIMVHVDYFVASAKYCFKYKLHA